MKEQTTTPTTGRGRPNGFHSSLDDLKSQLSGDQNEEAKVGQGNNQDQSHASKEFLLDAVIPPLKIREPTVAVSLYLKKGVHTRLKRTAMNSEISMNKLIGNLVERWLDAVEHHH
ncbi:MAG: hypothetical protein HQL50_01685 [Magnetococcales bacterium]|nr:hypothetical protein [Magnetococcales bacterium]